MANNSGISVAMKILYNRLLLYVTAITSNTTNLGNGSSRHFKQKSA